MNKQYKNIYKSARIRAGLKREPAAEELHIDVRTLDKYESIGGKPPDETVRNMCELYSNKFLAYQHIKKSPLGEFLPELSEESFERSTLKVISGIYSVNDILREFIDIAANGEQDKKNWQEVKTTLTALVSALATLLLSSEKGENNE